VGLLAAVGADEQSALVVEVTDGALDGPAVLAQPGAVLGLATRDHGFDPSFPELAPVAVVVVAAVGEQLLGPAAGPSDTAAHRRDRVDQRQ